MWQNLNHELLRQQIEFRRADLMREAQQQRLAQQAVAANHSAKAEIGGSARKTLAAWLNVQLHKITGTYHPEPAAPCRDMDWTPQSPCIHFGEPS
jgi:hypothetical protein